MERKSILTAIVIQLLVLLLCISGMALSQDENLVAVVIRINGNLLFRATDGEEWRAAKKMDYLYDGYQLMTETGDKAMIQYTNGSRILINENTTLAVQAEVEPGARKAGVQRTRLILGEVYSRVRGGAEFEVETPSSVASVRGTEFNTLFLEGEAVFIGVQGVIQVMNQLGSVIIQQLQRTSVSTGQAPSEPETLTQDQVNKLTEWKNTVEPTWELNMTPEGGTSQATNGTFSVTITARRDGSVDMNASFSLAEFSADAGIIEFSADNGKTWNATPPTITFVNGQAVVSCRITEEGSVTLTARAEDCEPAALGVSAKQAKEKKTIELMFTEPDGSGEKIMIWELEEK